MSVGQVAATELSKRKVRALRELKHLEGLKAKGSSAVTRSSSATWLGVGVGLGLGVGLG